jgi:hypothetical protein
MGREVRRCAKTVVDRPLLAESTSTVCARKQDRRLTTSLWSAHCSPADREPGKELALFNLGIDSKLRGCDLVSLKIRDVCQGGQVGSRAVVMQHRIQRPVQFEIAQGWPLTVIGPDPLRAPASVPAASAPAWHTTVGSAFSIARSR